MKKVSTKYSLVHHIAKCTKVAHCDIETLDMPAAPVRHVGPAVLGKCLYNVNDLRDTSGKQGLEVAKWITFENDQSCRC